jgi:hypothetical protein
MELYPIRNLFGFSDLGWYLARRVRKLRSRNWISAEAIVEGYELLASRDNGWLVVFYSYEYDGNQFSGEFRKWLLSWNWLLVNASSLEEKADKVISRFPRGSTVRVRIDARSPAHSVTET